jgi:preprotein translocase subunit YajC
VGEATGVIDVSSFFQNAPQKAGTPGVVVPDAPAAGAAGTPGAAGPGGGGGFMGSPMFMVVMMLAVFAPILFMNSRRQKKESQARAQMKKGDRVVSTTGLIGELVELTDGEAKVKLAPGVTVQMMSNVISPYAPAQAKPTELKDAKPVTDKK